MLLLNAYSLDCIGNDIERRTEIKGWPIVRRLDGLNSPQLCTEHRSNLRWQEIELDTLSCCVKQERKTL